MTPIFFGLLMKAASFAHRSAFRIGYQPVCLTLKAEINRFGSVPAFFIGDLCPNTSHPLYL